MHWKYNTNVNFGKIIFYNMELFWIKWSIPILVTGNWFLYIICCYLETIYPTMKDKRKDIKNYN